MFGLRGVLSVMLGSAYIAVFNTLNTIKDHINPFHYLKLDLCPKPNYSQIVPGLYLSNAEAAGDRSILHSLFITHVLTINNQRLPSSTFRGTRISNLYIRAADAVSTNLLPYFPNTNAFIEEGIQNGNVIVHCQFGVSRSATLVIAYLMEKYQMTFKRGLAYVRSRRHIVNPNPGFCEQLKEYERSGYKVGRCATARASIGQHKMKLAAIATIVIFLWWRGTFVF